MVGEPRTSALGSSSRHAPSSVSVPNLGLAPLERCHEGVVDAGVDINARLSGAEVGGVGSAYAGEVECGRAAQINIDEGRSVGEREVACRFLGR